MNGAPLTAALRLTLQDEASGGVRSLDALFGKLNETLDRLATAMAPLERLIAPLTQATEATDRLDRALGGATQGATRAAEAGRAAGAAYEGLSAAFTQAAWQASSLSVNLGEVGGAAVTAGAEGESMGAEIAGGAVRATSALDAMLARLREIRTAMGGAAAGAMGAAGGFFGPISEAGRGFSESLQHSMHHGMTAAMAGVGILEPIHAVAEYDNLLTHIGITEGKTGDQNAPFAHALGRRIDQLARQTGQRGLDLAEAASFLSMEGYSLDGIMSLMPSVARISTAYNANPDAVAKTTFALGQNFKITSAQMPVALAMMARVGKESALPLEELAPLFPEVAAAAAQIGVKGPQGVADIASMMAVIRKNVGSEMKATTDLRQVMSTLTSSHGRHRFRKLLGWDPRDVMDKAQDAGKDPLSAVLDRINAIPNARTRQHAISDLFVNMEDQTGASAIIRDFTAMMDIRGRIQNTSPDMVNKDYATGLTSPKTQLQMFEESLAQLNRRIGRGFLPTLGRMTAALNLINEKWEWLDVHVPGLTSYFTGFAGTTLGLTAAIAALRAVSSPLVAALRLLASPLRVALSLSRSLSVAMGLGRIATIAMGGAFVAIAAVAVAAIGDIALHWSRFSGMFHALGHGVLEEWRGLGNFIAGVFTGNWDRALHGLGQSFRGFSTALGGGFGVFKQLFLDFAHWLDGWTGGLPSRILSGITAEWHVLTDGLTNKLHDLERAFDHSWLGQHMGFAAPVPAAAVAVPVAGAHNAAGRAQQVNLHVTADRGLQVRQTGGPTHGVTIAQPNTGRMVGRP